VTWQTLTDWERFPARRAVGYAEGRT